MLTRFPDWHARLATEIERARSRTFEWGKFDCALFACDCVLAVTGVDPAAEFRGTYSTEDEARKLLGTEGLDGFASAIAGKTELKEISPTFAQRGDVVLVENGDPTRALGVVGLDGRFVLCASEPGLARVPMKRWLRAWRIG